MKKSKGFSLVELMVVLGIIGILTAVAIGFFGDSATSAYRSEGQRTLEQVAASLEKCKGLYGVYNSANCNVAFPVASENNYYSIAATAMATTTFTLTASPVAGQPPASDTDCTTLTFTNTHIKGATGANPGECW